MQIDPAKEDQHREVPVKSSAKPWVVAALLGFALLVVECVGGTTAPAGGHGFTAGEVDKRLFLEVAPPVLAVMLKVANGPSLIESGRHRFTSRSLRAACPWLHRVRRRRTRKSSTPTSRSLLCRRGCVTGSRPRDPGAEQLDFADADVAEGGVLFRICAQVPGCWCGALTQTERTEPDGYDPQEIYEAMLTGPQNMPVFSDQTLRSKRSSKSSPTSTHSKRRQPRRHVLGRLGPVVEGLFMWTAVFAA